MGIKLVKNIEVKDSQSKHESFKDDLSTDKIYSIVDCFPIPDQKLLKVTLEGGDTLLIAGELIDTSGLLVGEKRLKATDENGQEKISMILHNDGTIEFKGGSKEMINALSDTLLRILERAKLIDEIINGLATATIPTALGGAVLSALYPAYAVKYPQATAKTALIESEKGKFDEYKKV